MLEFDSWQRCETVRHLLNWALPDPGRVLDVGGYPGRLRGMIPQHDWVICDPLVDAPGDQMRGSAIHLPVRDQSFDVSVSLDVLEHIQPEDRLNVLQEMIRVSRMGLILTFPTRDSLVESAEKKICDLYTQLYQKEHPWLTEHARYPLPDADEITQYLLSFGGQVAVFDVGDITRWVYLQSLDILLESMPGSLDLARRLDQIYQEKLYIHDFKPPAYRKIILHMFHIDEPISLSMIETSRIEQTADDIEYYQNVISGLLDLIMRERPSLQAPVIEEVVSTPVEIPATEPEIESQPAEPHEPEPPPEPEAEAPKEFEPPLSSQELKKTELSVATGVKPEGYDEYVSRLESGIQAWEETYSAALHEMTEIYRWWNNLQQRRSFRIYKKIMKILGVKIDP